MGARRDATSGLIGRLDLAGTWWAIIPGVEAGYGAAHAGDLITDLAGGPVEHEVLATDPWSARMLVADRFADRRVFLVGESAHVNPPVADVTAYTPSTDPGARLPHHWLPDGSSLYDHLGRGFTLVGPVSSDASDVADLVRRARRRRIPLTLAQAPASYPWRDEFLLVRPDQHIAWRAADPAGIDLEAAAGFAPGL